MKEKKTQRLNIDVDKTLWKAIGVVAAKKGISKKELLDRALRLYWVDHKEDGGE